MSESESVENSSASQLDALQDEPGGVVRLVPPTKSRKLLWLKI